MHCLQSIRSWVKLQAKRRAWALIFQANREFTMIPEEIFQENLQLADAVRHVPGCVVECGVWRGGMSAGLARVLGPTRSYYLFDSFAGLPPAQPIDGPAAIEWQRDTASPRYYDNCTASPEFAKRAMQLAGIDSFHLVEGWFAQTIPSFVLPEPIALLRLDGDWYESTLICLEHFFDRVAPGGVVILDDYYTWDGCSRALHEFLSCSQAAERIRNLGATCYLTKVQNP